MKKFICLLLCFIMMMSAVTMVACTTEPSTNEGATGTNTESATEAATEAETEDADATLKFGFGVYTDVSKASDATEDNNGEGKVAITAAAVLVDADGKIVACVLDTAENVANYTNEGKAIAAGEFLTKGEKGDNYNMVAYGGAAKEWYQQADAFEGVVVGKTLTEVKALVAGEDNKGTDEVINAGCTIMVKEFVLAVEKAMNAAVASNATAANTLKLGVSTAQTNKDATEDKDGSSKLETTIFAAAVDAEGKVVAAASDCVQVEFTFDLTGASTYDLTQAVVSKKEAGDDYGMVAFGGATLEWYKQAAAFDTACIGKTAAEIASLMGEDNYGTADLKAAGCTILVNGFVKAAAKIA